jgi:hypothetical protein
VSHGAAGAEGEGILIRCNECGKDMRPGTQPRAAACTSCLVARQGDTGVERALEDYIDDLRSHLERTRA